VGHPAPATRAQKPILAFPSFCQGLNVRVIPLWEIADVLNTSTARRASDAKNERIFAIGQEKIRIDTPAKEDGYQSQSPVLWATEHR
jgi:hypothetical protein